MLNQVSKNESCHVIISTTIYKKQGLSVGAVENIFWRQGVTNTVVIRIAATRHVKTIIIMINCGRDKK